MVEVKNLAKRYGGTVAVDDVSFTIPPGESISLLGPSGCGKTTTLRCVAGLEEIDDGAIIIDGETVSSVRPKVYRVPEKRDVGLVFQSYALWPNKTVHENIAFGLRARRLNRQEVERRIRSVIETLYLQGLERRYPSQLSGGQQQRVALARALAYEPKVLLLDEPLSNLDQKVREHVRLELRSILHRLNITSLHVTHDQEEAFVMSGKVILMDHGRIIQSGTPEELYGSPKDEFVASFIGRTNAFKGVLAPETNRGAAAASVRLESSDVTLQVDRGSAVEVESGDCTVVLRPNEIGISVGRPPPSERNVLVGEIKERIYRGSVTDYRIDIGGLEVTVTTHRFCTFASVDGATKVFLMVPSKAIVVLPRTTGRTPSAPASTATE